MMMLVVNIVDRGAITYTESVHQHDKNVTILFEGVDLPDKYEVIFSNSKDRGISVSCEGSSENGVMIPDALLSTGDYVYGWVCDNNVTDARTTVFQITIPVIPRPVPVPVQVIHEKSEEIQYEIHADDENLTFISLPNGVLEPIHEEET